MERLDAAGGVVIGAVLNRAVLDRAGESYLPVLHQDYETYYAQQTGTAWLPELPETLSQPGSSGTVTPVAHG